MLRLIIMGDSGVGKSAAGNTILRKEEFESEASPSSLTLRSEAGEGTVFGRRVLAVDTPGQFNTKLSEKNLREELNRALNLCYPGPNVFLLVIQLGRFTQQEKQVIETLQKLFSRNVNQYLMVLFTYGDRLGSTDIKEFIKQDKNLQNLLMKCGNRYHVFNNEDQNNTDQVMNLFKKIDENMMSPKFFEVTEEGFNTKTAGIFSSILSVQHFAKPILGGVLGGIFGGLTRTILGACLGGAVGCVVTASATSSQQLDSLRLKYGIKDESARQRQGATLLLSE